MNGIERIPTVSYLISEKIIFKGSSTICTQFYMLCSFNFASKLNYLCNKHEKKFVGIIMLTQKGRH